jgi:predicted cupin superfamily sugar epimerase
MDIEKLTQILHLEPLIPEGGLFSQTYRSSEIIEIEHLPGRYPSRRRFGSAILFLLTDEEKSFSAMHRLVTDEIYHFYLGDAVEMLLLHLDGSSQHIILGQDILNGQHVQFTVPHGCWQGSHLFPGGRYALLGTTMAPGYEPDEFDLGERAELSCQYPGESGLIQQLTRG